MVEDHGGVDRCPDVVRQRRICIAFIECVGFLVREVAQPRRKAFADLGEPSEDMIACTARIGEMFLDVEDRLPSTQTSADRSRSRKTASEAFS